MPESTQLNIGQAAKAAGMNAKMIRHYESIGLVPKAQRTEAGYRVYGPVEVHSLRFIKRSRDLGFPLQEIKALLSLWRNKKRASSQVKKLVSSHISRLNEKIQEMQEMRNALQELAQHCRGDERPECPILSNLEDAEGKNR